MNSVPFAAEQPVKESRGIVTRNREKLEKQKESANRACVMGKGWGGNRVSGQPGSSGLNAGGRPRRLEDTHPLQAHVK